MAGIYSASGWWANQHPGTATWMEAPKKYFIRVMIIYQHFTVLEHNPFLETKTKPCLNYLTLQYELNYITPEGCHELERQTKKQKHKARRILSWNRLKSTQATKHAFVFRIHVKEATLQRSSEQTSTSCSSTRRCPAVKRWTSLKHSCSGERLAQLLSVNNRTHLVKTVHWHHERSRKLQHHSTRGLIKYSHSKQSLKDKEMIRSLRNYNHRRELRKILNSSFHLSKR